jgi:RHS repeat-associated protein
MHAPARRHIFIGVTAVVAAAMVFPTSAPAAVESPGSRTLPRPKVTFAPQKVESPGRAVGTRKARTTPVKPAPAPTRLTPLTVQGDTVAVDGRAHTLRTVRIAVSQSKPSLHAKATASPTASSQAASLDVAVAPAGAGLTVTTTGSLPGGGTVTLDLSGNLTATAIARLVARQGGKAIPLQRDTANGTVAFKVNSGALVATTLTAGTASDAGNYSATELSPAASWSAGSQTGSFSWTYPLTAPPSAGGLDPALALGYDSGALDGVTAATNNQASWVGDGFSFESGYVQRSYRRCNDDKTSGSNASKDVGDLCWGPDNASIVLNGKSSRLIRVGSTDKYRLEDDSGAIVQKLTGAANGDAGTAGVDGAGEHWVVTETDGTKYYFGLEKRYAGDTHDTNSTLLVPVNGNQSGEACYDATFADGFCTQAWKWNLDYVVDVHGNTVTYTYTKEGNSYARNGATTSPVDYDRAGYLSTIDYGQRAGTETDANVQQQVRMDVAERCTGSSCAPGDLTAATQLSWPDTPFDLICATSASTCDVTSPSFFTRKRLTTITTSYRGAAGLVDVDRYALGQHFPASLDAGGSPLWLDSITRTGLVGGTAATPPVTFGGVVLANRVDEPGDGATPLYRYRVNSITSESGGLTTVAYLPDECTPATVPAEDAGTKRCYPQYWTVPGATDPTLGWFHKHVVASVTEDGRFTTSQPKVTRYTYATPAWSKDDSIVTAANQRTWSQWRGYGTVTTTVGDLNEPNPLKTVIKYLQGMDGDPLKAGGTRSVSVTINGAATPDKDQWAGTSYESTTYNGAAALATTYTTPWTSAATATDPQGSAYRTDTSSTVTKTTTSPGTRTTSTSTSSRDSNGFPTQVRDDGDTSLTSDDRCQTTTYAPVGAANLQGLVATDQSLASTCGTAARADGLDVVSSTRTTYAPLEGGGAPTTGDVAKVERLVPAAGGTTAFAVTEQSTYDALGRVKTSTIPSATQANGRTTTTVYTPADNSPTTQTTSSVANSQTSSTHTTTTTIDPARGTSTAVADANQRVTSRAYDPLGRVKSIWLPSKAAGSVDPHYTFAYTLSSTGTNTVTTNKFNGTGLPYTTSTAILDGLLRPVQTQTPVADISTIPNTINRALTDTSFDSRGLAVTTRGPWQDGASAPNGTYVTKLDQEVPKATYTTFDGAGRVTLVRNLSYGVIQTAQNTATAYAGDYTEVTPPVGGTATRTVVDARGQTAQLWQYKASPPNGTTAKDITSYTYDGRGNLTQVKDQAGTIWTWDFDAANRMWRATDPDKGITTTTFNVDDSVATTTDAKNTVLTYGYDDLGRKTSLKKGTANLATWTYDPAGNLGLLAASSSFVGTAEYKTTVNTYNVLSLPTKTTLMLPSTETGLYQAGGYVRTTGYDWHGNPKSSAMPTLTGMGLPAETWNIINNDLGQPSSLETLTTYGGMVVNGTQRDETGAVVQQALGQVTGKTVYLNQGYDPGTGRLATQRITRDNIAQPDVNLTYGYDGIGNITMLRDAPSGATAASTDQQCFQYDYLRRLTDAWSNGTVGSCPTSPVYTASGASPYRTGFTYDTMGNRKTETRWNTTATTDTLTWTYPAATATVVGATTPTPPHAPSNVQTKVGTGTAVQANFTYGKDGATLTTPLNQTSAYMSTAASGKASTLTWDDLGRLATVKYDTTAVTTANVYDTDGNLLIKKTSDGGKTLMLGDTEITYKGTALTSRRLLSFNGQIVAFRTAQNTAGLWLTPPNQQGTPSVQINASTATTTKRYYTPFGAPRGSVTGWQGTGGFLGATGATTDLTSQLVELGARNYDPSNGRFLSVDPVFASQDPASFSSYNYSNQNPITYSDPTGTRPLGAGDTACTNCRVAYNTPAKKRPKHSYTPARKSQWRYGNERFSDKSVYGKHYQGDYYSGNGRNHFEKQANAAAQADHSHDALIGLGVSVSPVGAAADGANALWEARRGNWGEAALSAFFAIPGFGDAGQAIRALRSMDKAANTAGAGGRVFWSGSREAEAAAEQFAKQNGGQTLEMTARGRALKSANLEWTEAKPLWDSASADFASGAAGNVHVFHAAEGVRLRSAWAQVEWKILSGNPNVALTFHTVGGG